MNSWSSFLAMQWCGLSRGIRKGRLMHPQASPWGEGFDLYWMIQLKRFIFFHKAVLAVGLVLSQPAYWPQSLDIGVLVPCVVAFQQERAEFFLSIFLWSPSQYLNSSWSSIHQSLYWSLTPTNSGARWLAAVCLRLRGTMPCAQGKLLTSAWPLS